MSFSLVFWFLMLCWVVFGLWQWYIPDGRWWYMHGILLFALFLLLGWREFGAPIHP